MVELFSIAAGLAFVISGVLNGLTFWAAWGLNYYSIASPGDVVMSGFILITLVVIVTIVVATLTGAILWLNKGDWVKPEIVADDYADDVVKDAARKARMSKPDRDRLRAEMKSVRHQQISRLMKKYVWTLIATVSVGYAATQVAVGGRSLGVFQAIVARPFWYETGLNVIDKPGADPCDGAHVAWLGSSSAILECQDGVRVIHNLDELETVRRHR